MTVQRPINQFADIIIVQNKRLIFKRKYVIIGALDEYQEFIKATFAKWVQITDNKAVCTLEDFSYNTGVDENITGGCCWKCVSVN